MIDLTGAQVALAIAGIGFAAFVVAMFLLAGCS